MRSGPRDTVIIIDALDEVEVGIGTTQNWVEYMRAWSNVNYGAGSERRAADGEQSSVVATFQIPTSAKGRAITPSHRLRIKSEPETALWDIISAVPSRLSDGVDITAKRSGDHGQSENP